MAVQKEGRGLGESPTAVHSRRDCPTAFKSELKYCCEFVHLFSAVCTALLVLEESLLPCSLCRATAERAPGPERAQTRANLLSWLADMDVPVKIKVLIPREQLCVLHENHCTKHIWKPTPCSHPCRRRAGTYSSAAKYTTAAQKPWSDFQVLKQFYNSICTRAAVQGQSREERAGTSDVPFLHVVCCLV